jgi:hypothetical protein
MEQKRKRTDWAFLTNSTVKLPFVFIYVLSMISQWQQLVRHCWWNWKKDPLSRLLSPNDECS